MAPVPVPDERFDDFYAFDYGRLVGALTLVVGDVDTARDAVDEAVARALTYERRGRRIDSLGAWVRVAALNVARSRYRKGAAERRARDRLAALATSGAPIDVPVAVDVARALAALPRRQREVVVLHYLCDVSVDDVAGALGITTGTVKTSLHRARLALAAQLHEEMCEP